MILRKPNQRIAAKYTEKLTHIRIIFSRRKFLGELFSIGEKPLTVIARNSLFANVSSLFTKILMPGSWLSSWDMAVSEVNFIVLS